MAGEALQDPGSIFRWQSDVIRGNAVTLVWLREKDEKINTNLFLALSTHSLTWHIFDIVIHTLPSSRSCYRCRCSLCRWKPHISLGQCRSKIAPYSRHSSCPLRIGCRKLRFWSWDNCTYSIESLSYGLLWPSCKDEKIKFGGVKNLAIIPWLYVYIFINPKKSLNFYFFSGQGATVVLAILRYFFQPLIKNTFVSAISFC